MGTTPPSIQADYIVRYPGGLCWEAYAGGRVIARWYAGMLTWRLT